MKNTKIEGSGGAAAKPEPTPPILDEAEVNGEDVPKIQDTPKFKGTDKKNKEKIKKEETKMAEEETTKTQTIRDHQDMKVFRCKNCSDTDGDVWVSWKQAIKAEPNSDRTLLLCPYCKNQFGVFSLDNPVDPDFKPENEKQGPPPTFG